VPRNSNPVPSYLLHKQSGQARVRVQGRDVLVGPYNSRESRQRYAEILTQMTAGMPSACLRCREVQRQPIRV
jgi:hypothetical protein